MNKTQNLVKKTILQQPVKTAQPVILSAGQHPEGKTYHRNWQWWVHGVKGIFKSLLRIDTVTQEIRQQRWMTCLHCGKIQDMARFFPKKARCFVCGCVVWHKAHMAAEDCPLGKWRQNIEN